jgi:hypothetical protein
LGTELGWSQADKISSFMLYTSSRFLPSLSEPNSRDLPKSMQER